MLKTFLRRQHPSYDILSLLADGELSASEAMAVNAHLAECRECREEVDFMVDLRGRLQALTGPAPPRSTLPDILSARAMGERRILDFSDEPQHEPTRTFWRTAAPVAAVVSLVAVSFAMFAAGSVEAGSSSLEFDIETAGQPFELVFNTSGRLAEAEEATVVARTFGRYDPVWPPRAQRVQATLVRSGAGTFSGSMTLPSTASFARFEIEGPDGGSDPAGWRSFLARRADGQPTFDALANLLQFQYETDAIPDVEAIEQLTDLYGDNPYAWRLSHFLEGEYGLIDPTGEARYVERLEAFGRELPTASADLAGGVVAFASMLGWDAGRDDGSPEARVGWQALRRLREVAPSHPELVTAEAVRIGQRWEDRPGQLEAFEELWNAHGSGGIDLYNLALGAAIYAGDGRAIVRWADRWLAEDPAAVGDIVTVLGTSVANSDHPQPEPLLSKVESLLSEYERRFSPSGSAPLRSREVYDAGRAQALDLIGLLLERGDRLEEAHDARAAAAELEPRHARFVALADLSLRLGRRHGEANALARALQLTDDADARLSIEARLRALPLSASDLAGIREDARVDMRARVFTPDRIRPSGPIEVRDRHGRLVDFGEHLGSDATLVYFVESRFPRTLIEAESLAGRCVELAARGITIRFVTDAEAHAGLQRRLDAEGCGDALFVDGVRRLRRLYDAPVLRQVLVLSSEGALYFRDSELGDALVRARILSEGR